MPLSTGTIAVSGPTAGANWFIASSSEYDFTPSRMRSNGSFRSSAAIVTAGTVKCRRHGEVTVWARYLQPGPRQLLSAPRAHQEGDIASAANKTGAEISAERACADHKDSHCGLPLFGRAQGDRKVRLCPAEWLSHPRRAAAASSRCRASGRI